jgi:hypothetical protein
MNETMMTSLLIQLADLGVTGVQIYYEGSGDSGCIDQVLYTTDKLPEDEENAFNKIRSLNSWEEDAKYLRNLDSGLSSDIENFATEKILDDLEDWWNNDGGYGTMCILVPSGKYDVMNSVRYTEVNTYTHVGNLIDQTLD